MGNLLSYFSTPPNNKFFLQEILLVIFQWISFYLRPCFSHHIQHSHFPWRARRRCGTAWGRRRRSSWCGRGCTWPACWWRIWPEDRRHSRASTAPVHSNSISEEEEERMEAAQHPHKHNTTQGDASPAGEEAWRAEHTREAKIIKVSLFI